MPSKLDLIFTKKVDLKKRDVGYKSPLGKSDHVTMEMVMGGIEWDQGDKYKEKRNKQEINMAQ